MNKKFLSEVGAKVVSGLVITSIIFGANWCRQTSKRLDRIEVKLGINTPAIAINSHE